MKEVFGSGYYLYINILTNLFISMLLYISQVVNCIIFYVTSQIRQNTLFKGL